MEHRPLTEQVKNALSSGDVRKAAVLLGSFYKISGIVVHGNHLGRTIGFPTANIQIDPHEPLILSYGVYAVQAALHNRRINGMANVGVRPTVDGSTPTIEVHLFDFQDDIYGQRLDVYLIERIRDEQKFQGIEALCEQLNQDKAVVESFFRTWREPDAGSVNTLG